MLNDFLDAEEGPRIL